MTSLFQPACADTGYALFRFRWFSCRLRSLLRRRYDRHLQRLDLAVLDVWQLNDLGLTPGDVRRECTKSFWRL